MTPSPDDAAGEALIRLFSRANERLRKAVAGLDPAALDRVLAPDTNSIAVLVTHSARSEMGWLHVAAGRPFERVREEEFRVRGKTARDLAEVIDRAADAMPDLVRAAIAGGLDTTRRTRDGRDTSAADALFHALEHLTEHVGQIELTRQLVTRD
ncbi:MAG TPA: DinB family protein [Candidatus Dormibacteraeota bacterium]|nr:DinB family protein [Candidatus Dormibacteraeota bacterium]